MSASSAGDDPAGSIEVLDESGGTAADGGLSPEQLADLASFAFERMHLDPATELSIALVAAERMAELHVEWMDEPGPTDVLSFPMDELAPGTPESPTAPGILGDIVLCPQVSAAQAAAAGHLASHETAILLVHGILHLLGYDHAEPGEKERMFTLQASIVDQWEQR